jgi:hypothetical protein
MALVAVGKMKQMGRPVGSQGALSVHPLTDSPESRCGFVGANWDAARRRRLALAWRGYV